MLDETTPGATEPASETSGSPPLVAWAPAAGPGGSAHLVPGAEALQYAGAIPRAAAYLLDGLLFFILAVGVLILFILAVPKLATSEVLTLGLMALQAAYFWLGWRSGGRATPGMRVLKLQIGQAADGQRISSAQAVTRWFVLTGWISLLSVIPALSSVVSLIGLVWIIVLLVSVVTGARHQGLHDRISGTALVQPVGASSATGWIIVIAMFVVIPFLAIIALIYLGSQVGGLLSTVGVPQ